jgi:adenylate cyclase
MNAKTSVAHRLGRVLETMTRQSGRLPETPEYGSWYWARCRKARGVGECAYRSS